MCSNKECVITHLDDRSALVKFNDYHGARVDITQLQVYSPPPDVDVLDSNKYATFTTRKDGGFNLAIQKKFQQTIIENIQKVLNFDTASPSEILQNVRRLELLHLACTGGEPERKENYSMNEIEVEKIRILNIIDYLILKAEFSENEFILNQNALNQVKDSVKNELGQTFTGNTIQFCGDVIYSLESHIRRGIKIYSFQFKNKNTFLGNFFKSKQIYEFHGVTIDVNFALGLFNDQHFTDMLIEIINDKDTWKNEKERFFRVNDTILKRVNAAQDVLSKIYQSQKYNDLLQSLTEDERKQYLEGQTKIMRHDKNFTIPYERWCEINQLFSAIHNECSQDNVRSTIKNINSRNTSVTYNCEECGRQWYTESF